MISALKDTLKAAETWSEDDWGLGEGRFAKGQDEIV
jgi:hypothetical protein